MANSVIFRFIAIDKFKPVASKMGRQMDQLSSKFKRIKSTGTDAFRGIAAAVVGYLSAAKAVSTVTTLEDALADLSAITGATGKDLEFLTGETMRLAKEGSKASAEVAAAFKGVASAKSELLQDPKALSEVTEKVILLSNTGVDLATATDTVTKSLNQFNAGAGKAGEFVDVLAKGAQIGASEVLDTGQAVEKAGAVAASVSVDFAQLNAAIQVLAKGGIKGSEAGTMLRTVLLNLATQADQKLNPKIVGITKAFENLAAAELNTTQMKKLFGNEAIVAGEILSKNNKLFSRWATEIRGVGSAQAQADIRLNTFTSRVRKLGAVITEKLMFVFSAMAPQLTDITAGFTNWVDSLDTVELQAFANVAKGLLGTLQGIGKVLMVIPKGLISTGKLIGMTAGAVATGDYEDLKNNVSLMPKSSGIPAQLTKSVMASAARLPPLTTLEAPRNDSGQIDVNVNLNAPDGVIQSVKTVAAGMAKSMNVGTNMATQ